MSVLITERRVNIVRTHKTEGGILPVLLTQGGRNIVRTDNREGGILSVLITGREEYYPY